MLDKTTALVGVSRSNTRWPNMPIRLLGITNGFDLDGDDLRVRWQRARLLMAGEFRGWVDANLERLARVRHRMPEHNVAVLDALVQARQRRLPGRLIGFLRSGIHRQTALGNLGLAVAALFNKL